jgi:hypothetical protein
LLAAQLWSDGVRWGKGWQAKGPPQWVGLFWIVYSIKGIENSPPSFIPEGQRDVIVLVRV